jgi:hypothetical protein
MENTKLVVSNFVMRHPSEQEEGEEKDVHISK